MNKEFKTHRELVLYLSHFIKAMDDNKIKEIQDKVEEYEFNCICGYSAPTEEEGTHIDEERGGWKACNNCGMI